MALPGATVRPGGGGSSDGTFDSRANIETALAASRVADHYAAALAQAG